MNNLPVFCFIFNEISLLNSVLTSDPLYLDPGSGSFILQIIVASLLGVGFLIKTYWRKITAFFKGASRRDEQEEDR